MGTGIELSNAPVWSGALTGQEVLPMGRGDGQPWAMELSSIFQLQNYIVTSNLVNAALDANLAGRNIVVSEPLALDENLAWPTDRTLEIVYGGRVTISSGMTLSFTADSLIAGKHHIFSGTGSVTGMKVAYPEWFASNDSPGTTDMTAAIQAACNSLTAGGKVVSCGDQFISSTITVSYPTLFTSDSASYNRARFINLTDTALTMFNIVSGHGTRFENITLWGAGKTGTSIGVVVGNGTTNIDMVSLDNAEIYGFSVGIEYKTQNWRIQNNSLITMCGIGVLMTGLPSSADRRNAYIHGSWFHSCDTGISAPNAWFSVGIDDNDFNSCGNGVAGYLSRSSVVNNKFHNMTGDEINVTSAGSSTNLGLIVADNIIHGSGTANTGTGITLTGDYGTVSDNVINAKGGHGIKIVGSLNRIIGNTAKDCDYFDSTTYDGINIAGNGNRVEGGNICRTTTGGASKQRYGICVASGSGNVIKNNTSEANKSGQISADIATNTIGQNVGYLTEKSGTASISSATSVVVAHGLAITPPTGSISVTPTTSLAGASFWINNVTSTNFTINASTSGSYSFWWKIN